MRRSCRHAALSVKGPVRKNNEDAVAVHAPGEDQSLPDAGAKPLSLDEFGRLFLVSDGVGGLKAGEIASRLTVETVAREVSISCARGMGSESESANRALFRAILKANEIVGEAAVTSPDQKGMAATLTALWILPGRALVGQVGDSRLYRMRDGRTTQVTEDQSRVAQLVREGKISPEEAHEHPERNVIDQAIGSDPASFHPIVFSLDVSPGDRFLLCSDGVTDGLDEKAIGGFLSADWTDDLAGHVGQLIDSAIRASGKDNLTALLVEVGGDPHPYLAPTAAVAGAKPSWVRPWFGVALTLAVLAFFYFHMEERGEQWEERLLKLEDDLAAALAPVSPPTLPPDLVEALERLSAHGEDLATLQLWRNRVDTLLADLAREAAELEDRLPEAAELSEEERELLQEQVTEARTLSLESRQEVDRTRQRLVDLIRQVERLEADFDFLRERFNDRFPLPSEEDGP